MGLVYIILSELLWAVELILIRKFFPTQNSITVSAITSIIGSLFYLPTLLVFREKFVPREWLILVILGFCAWFLAQIFYVKGIQQGVSSLAVALATLSLPLFSVIFGSLVLKEPFTLKIMAGGILMVIGFLIISL